jgi:hypothetical protein
MDGDEDALYCRRVVHEPRLIARLTPARHAATMRHTAMMEPPVLVSQVITCLTTDVFVFNSPSRNGKGLGG